MVAISSLLSLLFATAPIVTGAPVDVCAEKCGQSARRWFRFFGGHRNDEFDQLCYDDCAFEKKGLSARQPSDYLKGRKVKKRQDWDLAGPSTIEYGNPWLEASQHTADIATLGGEMAGEE